MIFLEYGQQTLNNFTSIGTNFGVLKLAQCFNNFERKCAADSRPQSLNVWWIISDLA
jgi:hypothetical protein